MYDGAGRKTSETNANGITTHYTYDNNGNITHTEASEVSGSNTIVHNISTMTYDLLGRKTSETDDDGRTTQYTYNNLGKIRSAISPDDSSISSNIVKYSYDEIGNLVRTVNSVNKCDEYLYDNQNKLLRHSIRHYRGGLSIATYPKYDKNENVRFEIDGNGITTEHV